MTMMERRALLCLFALANIFGSRANQLGFTSIDCGSPSETGDYEDRNTGITYRPDETFISTGVNSEIQGEYINDSLDRHLRTVRSFPGDQNKGTRNCYNLDTSLGKGQRYLIRATFMYGNYDGKNQTPRFDLYLGVEVWETVEISNPTSVIRKEIIHVLSSNYLYVCLVNTGTGTPFISALELRQLSPNAYSTSKTAESLAFFERWNFAPADPTKVIRYPEDMYDRVWMPYASPNYWVPLSTNLEIDTSNNYTPPLAAMQTAVTPKNATESLKFFWKTEDINEQFYVYMHFAEIVKLQRNEYRAFNINLNDALWYGAMIPQYLSIITISADGAEMRANFNYSLVRTENSTLPPIINALEAYKVKLFLQSQTDENDVEAILSIKSTYGVKRDWQGDPCLPQAFVWDGLDCIIYNNKSAPPKIKSLNLSSSGLTGNVSSYLSELTFLENLDLSNNKLNGLIPDFLAELTQLKVLNISGNQFSGSIPQNLLDKAKYGLELRTDGYDSDPCDADHCTNKGSHKFVVPLVVSVVASLVILAAVIVTLKLRRTRNKAVVKFGLKSNGKDRFTYSDLLKMTNNFRRVIGKGGFGRVYRGVTADGKQVAVKVLSKSSAQGFNEFQREAELLTRIHHRSLTYLVGYCYEGAHMALVYEYMSNGCLRDHILASDDDNVLSWSVRLQIAWDAAQGLDYLHNGCKPPIIHRDIKSSNILLNEKFEAKLGDFGLSRAFTKDDGSYVSTKVVGTPGYVDPEYSRTQRLHEKSDIYSFGIVILELITGRPAITGTGVKRHIVQWVSILLAKGEIRSIVDPKLRGMYDTNSVWKALEVAMACASPTSYKRPTMADVLSELKECLVAEKVRTEGQDTDSRDLLEVDSEVIDIEVGPR